MNINILNFLHIIRFHLATNFLFIFFKGALDFFHFHFVFFLDVIHDKIEVFCTWAILCTSNLLHNLLNFILILIFLFFNFWYFRFEILFFQDSYGLSSDIRIFGDQHLIYSLLVYNDGIKPGFRAKSRGLIFLLSFLGIKGDFFRVFDFLLGNILQIW